MSLTTSATYEPCHPFSTIPTTAISGLSNGANPTNHAFTISFPFWSYVPDSVEPVFPPTAMSKPLNIAAAVPLSSVTPA